MKPSQIISRDNSLLRRARDIRDGKIRDSIFIEGVRLCEDALSSRLSVEAVMYSEQVLGKERGRKLISGLTRAAKQSAEVSDKLLASISETKTPQGIIVLAARPAHDKNSFARKQTKQPLVVVLHEINNPANAGAVLRSAEAAGATGAIITANSSDPFSPKALRGAMGSAFRVPIWAGAKFAEVIKWCRDHRIQVFGTAANGAQLYTAVDWRLPSALIVGREASGLSDEESRAVDEIIRIPMPGSVESLNVAVAAGVVLFEAARQRAQK